MTISNITKLMITADRFNRQISIPELPNGSLPPPGHINPYCTPGLDITGMTASDFKIIPIDKKVIQQMKDITFEEIKRGYGMSDPNHDPVSDLIKSYYKRVAIDDRKHAGWTLEKIHQNEVCKIFDFIKSRIPNWQPGQRFDTRILDEYKQEIDIKA